MWLNPYGCQAEVSLPEILGGFGRALELLTVTNEKQYPPTNSLNSMVFRNL